MKRLIIFLCMFFTVLTLHAMAIQEEYRQAEEKARVSYAFGMAIGASFDLNALGIELDYAAFTDGFKAMLEDNPQFSEQEAIDIIEVALQEAMDRRAAVYRTREEEFLAMNRLRPEVIVTESGLQYEVLVEGDGEKPSANSVVRVIYTGTFIDGSPFDRSTEEDGAYIPLDLVIPGWAEGLLLMSVGSQYRLYIPAELAYGNEGIHGIIPPYSTLIFTVELLEIIESDYYDYWEY